VRPVDGERRKLAGSVIPVFLLVVPIRDRRSLRAAGPGSEVAWHRGGMQRSARVMVIRRRGLFMLGSGVPFRDNC